MDLKSWRQTEGLTQADLAAQVGCTKQAISGSENGTTPTLEMALVLIRLSKGAISLHKLISKRKYTKSEDVIAEPTGWDITEEGNHLDII